MSVKAVIDLIADDKRFKPALANAKKMLVGLRDTMNSVATSAKHMLIVGGGATAFFLKSAADQEAAVESLREALTASGQSADAWMDTLQKSAEMLQRVSTMDADAVVAMMAAFTNLGVGASKLEEASRAAVGLAVILRTDAQSAAVSYAKALNGNFMMLQRFIPALANAKTEQEKLAMVNKLAAAGFAQAQAKTSTFSGSLTQLKNMVGDVAEEIGLALFPSLKATMIQIKQAIPAILDWVKQNRELIVTITKWSAGLLVSAYLLPKVVAGISAVAVAVKGLVAAYRVLMGLGVGRMLQGMLMSPLASSIAAAAIAVGYLVSRFIEMQRQLDEVKKSAESVSSALQEMKAARDQASQADTLEEQIAAMNRLREATIRQADAEAESRGVFDDEFVFSSDQSEALKASSRKAEARLRTQAERIQHDIDRATEAIRQRDADLAGSAPTDEQIALGEAIEELTAKLREEATVAGMTAREVEILKVATRGATEEQLAELRALSEKAAAAEAVVEGEKRRADAEEKVAEALKKVREELDIAEGRATSDQIELFDLENLGVAEESVREIARLMDRKKAAEHRKEIQEEAAALKEAAKSEQERLADRLAQIKRLQDEGALQLPDVTKLVTDVVSNLRAEAPSMAGQFEGLADTFKRIQSAAAKPKRQEDLLKRLGDKAAEQVVAARELLKLLPMKDAIDRIKEIVAANVPVVGRFGR